MVTYKNGAGILSSIAETQFVISPAANLQPSTSA
jgi:hypothetical protein